MKFASLRRRSTNTRFGSVCLVFCISWKLFKVSIMESIHDRRLAFTLIELLVVIGIIGLLLAILLPTLSRVRGAARSTACMAHQREIAAAMLLHAVEHDGYMPLAGIVVPDDVPEGTTADLPAAVSDARRERYDYVTLGLSSFPSALGIAPLPAALLPQLGGTPASSGVDLLAWNAHAGNLASVFTCPDEARVDASTTFATVVIDFGGTRHRTDWPIPFHYAVNGQSLGYDNGDRFEKLRGQLTRVGDTSLSFLTADVDLSSGTGLLAWQVFRTDSDPATLGDRLNAPARFDDSPLPATLRHSGRINVAFADGRVEAVDGVDGLTQVWLKSE